METTPNQHRKQSPAGKESLINYVEELASAEEYPEGDAWISITDAARITRTSEAMARRWVTSGKVPIKPGDYGIPPRTRLVRLSDVAKIRPIIDPTAAISGEIRKLDLPSIPRQQQQIMQNYERILTEVTTLQQTHKQLTHQLTTQVEAAQAAMQASIEQLTQQYHEHYTNLLRHWRTTREALDTLETKQATEQLEILEKINALLTFDKKQAQQLQEIEECNKRQQQQLTELMTLLNTLQTELQQAKREMQKATEHVYQEVTKHATTLLEQAERSLLALEKRQQEALQTQAQELNQTIEQTASNFASNLQQLERDRAQDAATVSNQLEKMNNIIITTKQTTQASQQHSHTQEKRIDELQQQLENERKARHSLEQQLRALTQGTNTSKKGQERRK